MKPTTMPQTTPLADGDSVWSLISQYPPIRPVFEQLGFAVDELGWLPLRTLAAQRGVSIAEVRTLCRAALDQAAIDDPSILVLPGRKALVVKQKAMV